MSLETVIRAAELLACGSSNEAKQAATVFYRQAKTTFDKAEQAWAKAHQLQYALYDLQVELEEMP